MGKIGVFSFWSQVMIKKSEFLVYHSLAVLIWLVNNYYWRSQKAWLG